MLTRVKELLGFFRRTEKKSPHRKREPTDHVILVDGTMSVLDDGEETNVGLIYKLLAEGGEGRPINYLYEAGNQWEDWSSTLDIIEGRGINRQIKRAYGWLASRYEPGDRIFLIGFSRGAYAVRSLAGVIDMVGLLQREHATERMIRDAYRHYKETPDSEACAEFRAAYCRDDTPIEAVAVFDTVKALGFRAPFVWKWEEVKHAFHNHHLGPSIQPGFHALALDETRAAYKPVLWETDPEWNGHVEQVWFRGSHGDVGGQLNGYNVARPLSNIALCWMLTKLERCELALPKDWRSRFPTDADAPSVGSWRGWARFFLAREERVIGADASEKLHPLSEGRSKRGNGLPVADLMDGQVPHTA